MAKNPTVLFPYAALSAAARRLCSEAAAASSSSAAEGAVKSKPRYSSDRTILKPLYHRLSALGANPGRSVAQEMQEWLKEGKSITEFGLMIIVRELRKYRSYKLALELMDWMETGGMEMSGSKHSIRLDLIGKVKGVQYAEAYFSGLPDSGKNLQTYGALLNSYCSESMANEAIALYDKMKELNLASGSLVHNNLMNLYMKLGQPNKVQAIFQEMKANNIPPDIFTYSILMSSYGSLKDIDSVEKIIEEMKARGVAVNWSTYTQLAAVYNSAGLHEKADSALKKAEGLMDRRSRNPYHFLISLYAGAGNLAEVNRVWNSLKAAFTVSTNRSYYVMLMALSKLDGIDALKQCFEEWESACVNYDIKLVNVVIGTYLRKEMFTEAQSLFKKASEKGFGSDIRTLELFIDYFVKRHEMDLALKCFEVAVSQVEQRPWKPDKEKLNAFLKYFEEVKDVDGAEAFCKSLKKLNCLDGEAYESLLRTYVSAGKKDPLFYKRIKEDGIQMSCECEKLVETVCTTYWPALFQMSQGVFCFPDH